MSLKMMDAWLRSPSARMILKICFKDCSQPTPTLLAGDQIDRAAPRRWLLITREMAVPSKEGGASRWSVDHLLLDHDAIPTLVEIKWSSDTCIRREVVGQMLDYAANAIVYWPIEMIRARFEAHCQIHRGDPE